MTTRNNTEDTRSIIRKFIAENLLFDSKGLDLADDASFLDEGVVDSVGVMELVTFVTTRYNIEVDPQEITPENFDSVQRLAAFIERKQAVAGTQKPAVPPENKATVRS